MGTQLITLTIISIILAAIGVAKVLHEMYSKDGRQLLKVRPIGEYTTARGTTFDLSEYCVDSNNNLYSFNPKTWELNPQKGMDTLRCSDKSLDNQGHIVNSLRDTKGNKVTIRRDYIRFNMLGWLGRPTINLVVKKTTERHLELLSVPLEL